MQSAGTTLTNIAYLNQHYIMGKIHVNITTYHYEIPSSIDFPNAKGRQNIDI